MGRKVAGAVGATSSMELCLMYLEAGRDDMRLVLDYNEDDCIATCIVKDCTAVNKFMMVAAHETSVGSITNFVILVWFVDMS